jgi:DHA1 family multidrug resistance protein-like MFS transporter
VIVGGGISDIWSQVRDASSWSGTPIPDATSQDTWNPTDATQRERGSAIVVYSLCIVGGPTVAPVIGAAVSESYLTWRWTEYLVVILTSFVILIDLFFLPETSVSAILTSKARMLRLKTGRWGLHSQAETMDRSLDTFLHKTLFLPLKMLAFEPMVLLITT